MIHDFQVLDKHYLLDRYHKRLNEILKADNPLEEELAIVQRGIKYLERMIAAYPDNTENTS